MTATTGTADAAEVADTPTSTMHGLRPNVLGLPALFAQSIAVISPTMTAVLIIPLAFASAGQGTWLAYAFGTVMLLFVVFCLNQFAKRSAFAGSMYAYTAKGLGPDDRGVLGLDSHLGLLLHCRRRDVRVRRLLSTAGRRARVSRIDPPGLLLRPERAGVLDHRLQGHSGVDNPHACSSKACPSPASSPWPA